MITREDLQEAIAECQGERNPNAQTCIKLAAYYTIMEHLEGGGGEAAPPSYSHQAELPSLPQGDRRVVAYDGESDFARAVSGMPEEEAWAVMDELMLTLQALYPRLYAGVMRRVGG